MQRLLGRFLGIVAALAAASAFADDNPFGLPAQRDSKRPGSVMLHGGGDGLADEVRQEFVRLAGGHDARIVLMPSDMCQLGKDEDGRPLPGGETIAAYERRMASPRQYGRWEALGDAKQVASFQFLYNNPVADPDDSKFFAALEQATGVWLPVYDQEWLPKQFASDYPNRMSRFQLALRDVVARGGVVGGLGGGMSSLPETVIAGDAPSERGWVRADVRFGLALFNGAIVDRSFDARAGRLERLTEMLRNGPRLNRLNGTAGVERRTIGLGVERETVAILQGNTVRAMGDGRVHIFLKANGDRTIVWRTIEAGDEPLAIHSNSAAPQRRELPFANLKDGFVNPFGMPEPADPAHPGTAVLHGGGNKDEIVELFPKLAREAKPRLVLCPAARESCRPSADCNGTQLQERLEQIFAPWRRLQLQGLLQDLTYVTTNSPDDANRPAFVKPIAGADEMWFGGGDQEALATLVVDRLRPTLFQEEIRNILRRGGVVGGASAGLAIMPEVMIGGGEAADGRPARATLSRGLGAMKSVLAEQHFDARSGRIERLTGLLRDHKRLANFLPSCQPKNMIGLAVEEDTALIAQANHVRVSGKNLAHVFLQTDNPHEVVWHALKSGDAAILRPAHSGWTLELDDWEFGD
jgi:cyanophycinase